MRTTVTLDSDVEVHLNRLMAERGISFKEAINGVLRTGLGLGTPIDVAFPVFEMGEPLVDLTHANRVAAALEDGEIAQSLSVGR